MNTIRILQGVFLFLLIENTLMGQNAIEQKMDEDSTISSWHYPSIFIVSMDSIHQILIKEASFNLIKRIKINELFIHVIIDDVGNGRVEIMNPVKLIGKKASKTIVKNLQKTKIWVPAFNIDKDDGRKFYTSSLLPLIVNKEDLLKAIEQRDKKTKSNK